MKKIISIMLALLSVFTLVACKPSKEYEEMQSKISSLEQALQNQAKINADLDEMLKQQAENNALLKELLHQQQETLRKQQEDIALMDEKLDNLMSKPVEFTEQSPAFGPRETETELIKFETEYYEDWTEAYNDFIDYYENEYKQLAESFLYIIYPENDSKWVRSEFSILVEGNNEAITKPMIRERVYIYDEALGDYIYPDEIKEDGYWKRSLYLEFYAPSQPEELKEFNDSDEIVLFIKFGNNSTHPYLENYFNIYSYYGVCIGTCYYDVNADISQIWFQNYISNNLFIGD